MSNKRAFSADHLNQLLGLVGPHPSKRMQTSQGKAGAVRIPQSRKRSRKFLFDSLPDDVLSDIATRITGTEHDDSILDLTDTYPRFKSHIKTALRNSFKFTKNEPNQARWTLFLRHGIVQLDFTRFIGPSPLSLCMEKTLRAVSITDDVEFFRAIQGNKSLRALQVLIIGKCDDFRKLVSTISTLNLVALRLSVDIKDPSKCPFRLPSPKNLCPSSLGRVCPNVNVLFVSCAHLHPQNEAPLWQMLPKFPSVRSVCVQRQYPPSSALDILRKMSKVDIQFTPNSVELSSAIGSPVVKMNTIQSMDEEKFDLLSKCPHLDHLCFRMVEETEDAFLRFSRSQSMKALCINCHRYRYPNLPPRPGHPKWWVGVEMTQIRKDLFPRLAQVLPNLKSLSLGCVRIPVAAMVEMLSIIGGRLEALQHFFFDQDEPPFDRFETVVHGLLKYNPNLKAFGVLCDGLANDKIPGLQLVLAEKYFKLRAQMKRIDMVLERLKRRNPRLELTYVDRFLKITRCDRTNEIPVELNALAPPGNGVVAPGGAGVAG